MKQQETSILAEVETQTVKKHFARNAVICAVVAIVLCAVGYVVWNNTRTPDISAYADVPITVTGLSKSPLTITAADLVKLDCVNGSYTGEGKGANGESKASTVKCYGPKLETFLAKYGNGQTQASFGRVILTCSDGYEVVLRGEGLAGDIVMSVGAGTEALKENAQPCQFIIPSLPTGKWARGVVKIAFEK